MPEEMAATSLSFEGLFRWVSDGKEVSYKFMLEGVRIDRVGQWMARGKGVAVLSLALRFVWHERCMYGADGDNVARHVIVPFQRTGWV